MTDLKPHVTTTSDYTEITLCGEIDIGTAPALRAEVDTAILGGTRHLIVDLTSVTFIDSSGLHVLLDAVQRLGSGCVWAVISAAHIRRVFEITGIHELIPIVASVDVARTQSKARNIG